VPRYGYVCLYSCILNKRLFGKGSSEELIKLLPAEADEPPHSDLEAAPLGSTCCGGVNCDKWR